MVDIWAERSYHSWALNHCAARIMDRSFLKEIINCKR